MQFRSVRVEEVGPAGRAEVDSVEVLRSHTGVKELGSDKAGKIEVVFALTGEPQLGGVSSDCGGDVFSHLVTAGADRGAKGHEYFFGWNRHPLEDNGGDSCYRAPPARVGQPQRSGGGMAVEYRKAVGRPDSQEHAGLGFSHPCVGFGQLPRVLRPGDRSAVHLPKEAKRSGPHCPHESFRRFVLGKVSRPS